MKISLIIHSALGTTKTFGGVIASELIRQAHLVDTTILETDPPIKPHAGKPLQHIKIVNLPDCSNTDIIIIGGPVWGFSASPLVLKCIQELEHLKGRRVLPFVTQFFPLECMGGSQALAQMVVAARKSGATLLPGVSVQKLLHNIRKEMLIKAKVIAHTISHLPEGYSR